MNERFFSYCLKKFREKQDELGKFIGAEKEYSPMKQALKEKGLIKEDDHKEDLLYEIYQVVYFAVKQLNCSFFEAWNGDYIDIYEALILSLIHI